MREEEVRFLFLRTRGGLRGWRKARRQEDGGMAESQIKSKERVAERGEVFTAEREVKAMCDLVKDETERIDSRFLEPACGDGNFLAEILKRKLGAVTRKYRKSAYDWERNSLLALGSMYGVDILADNCEQCRERLFGIWEAEYRSVCKKECNDETRASAKFILSRNIVCGNALTYHIVDKNGEDVGTPIVFSEWTFPRNDAFIYRKDYIFEHLVNGDSGKVINATEDLFADIKQSDGEGIFIEEYKSHYRRLGNE